MSTSLAYAQSIIPVSCDEIVKITICQASTLDPPVLTKEYPYVYPTAFRFKPEAAPKYKKFTDANQIATIYPDGTRVEYRPFLLSTPAGIIANDTPYPISVNNRQIHMFFKSKKEGLKQHTRFAPK
jgi:hypothetical protein